MTQDQIVKLLQTVNDLINKLKGIAPKHWKGNDAPNTHHWDAGSIHPSGGVNLADLTYWINFQFTDGGKEHNVKVTAPLAAPGTPGGNDVISLDGAPTTNADFVLSSRIGLDSSGFYHRAVFEFHFTDAGGTKHDYRFDGDV